MVGGNRHILNVPLQNGEKPSEKKNNMKWEIYRAKFVTLLPADSAVRYLIRIFGYSNLRLLNIIMRKGRRGKQEAIKN